MKVIDYIFGKFFLFFKERWSSGIQDESHIDALKREWQEGMATVNLDSVEEAIETVRMSGCTWPPSIPEFIAMCEQRSGAPGAEEAWMIVVAPKDGKSLALAWGHPVVMAASRDPKLDIRNMKMMPLRKAMQFWKPVYNKYLGRMVTGTSYHFPNERQLPDRTRESITPEEKQNSKHLAGKSFAEIRKLLGA